MSGTWTPEREAEAARLWREGKSANAIARTLGGVTRVAVIGKIHRMGLGRETRAAIDERVRTKPKPKPRPATVCAVQGCGAKLSKANLSGVCKDHAHVAGRCRCAACAGGPVAIRRAAQPRPDVRVAEVPYPTSNSGVALKARVSLKREPWVVQ